MPKNQHFVRLDTFQLNSEIEKKVGPARTEIYLHLLSRFLSSKLCKSDFDKLCIATVGRENIHLHNALLRGIIKNVCVSKTPPLKRNALEASLGEKKEVNGFKRRTFISHDRTSKDSKGKSQVTEVFSSRGRPTCSIEDGEEVEQSTVRPGRTHTKNQPIEAPLGVFLTHTQNKLIGNSSNVETCYSVGQLPDTVSLKKKLEERLSMEGLEVSEGFTNLVNMGLDVFLKRLIKPCLESASVRSSPGVATCNSLCSERHVQKAHASVSASMVDFQVALELNPMMFGKDWPKYLDKSRLIASEECLKTELTLGRHAF